MKANISNEQLAKLTHELMAMKALAVAAMTEAARLSSENAPVDLRRVRSDALSFFDVFLQTAPDAGLKRAARKTGEDAMDQIIGTLEGMGAARN